MPHITFPVSYAAVLSDLVKEHGGDVNTLLSNSGLSASDFGNFDFRVSSQQLWGLITNAVSTTGEPALGLYFGQRLTLTSHGVLGYALMSCKNMQQVIEILMKYYYLLFEKAELNVDRDDEWVSISCRIGKNFPYSDVLSREIFFSGLLVSLKQLLHREDVDIKLKLSYPAPSYIEVYHQIFGRQIEFSAEDNKISFPASILDEQPEFANPAMLKIYQQQCDALLARMESCDGLSTQVRKFLLASGRPFPALEQTAKHFNMSSRTFRRRLEREGTSFQRILDLLRRELAETYLHNHAMSVENVAELLGFNDVSNFRRAFIRWTGISPAVYQKRKKNSADTATAGL